MFVQPQNVLYPLDKELELKMSGIRLGPGDAAGVREGARCEDGDPGHDPLLHMARSLDKMELREK